jgi:predicted ATPase with chaperone activity
MGNVDIHIEVTRAECEKLERTIADLVGSERIEPAHVAETIQHRPMGRS